MNRYLTTSIALKAFLLLISTLARYLKSSTYLKLCWTMKETEQNEGNVWFRACSCTQQWVSIVPMLTTKKRSTADSYSIYLANESISGNCCASSNLASSGLPMYVNDYQCKFHIYPFKVQRGKYSDWLTCILPAWQLEEFSSREISSGMHDILMHFS